MSGFSFGNLPIGTHSAVMGLAGLGLSARAAAPLFPGVVRAPAYFTEFWVALGALAFSILFLNHLLKLLRFPRAVRAEFADPAQFGFCGALPAGMALVAGGIAPYVPAVADALWWAAAALMLAFQVWALSRWLSGSMELAQVNAGWLIILVAGIIVPGPGLGLGHDEASRFLFGVSMVGAVPLTALLALRAALGPPLREALRPSWFILLVPPSLLYANGIALYPGLEALENLFFFAVALALALLIYARKLPLWPFGAAWWAFTFPLDALAYAAARYAQSHPSAPWKAVAASALLLATAFVTLVLARTIWSFATDRSAASRAA